MQGEEYRMTVLQTSGCYCIKVVVMVWMVISPKIFPCQIPGTCKYYVIWKKVFEDVIKRLGDCIIPDDTKSNDKSYKRKFKTKEEKTHIEANVKMRQRCGHKPKNPRNANSNKKIIQ